MKQIEILHAAMILLLLMGTAALGRAQNNDDKHGNQGRQDRQAQGSGEQRGQQQGSHDNRQQQKYEHDRRQQDARDSRQQNQQRQQYEQRQQPNRNEPVQAQRGQEQQRVQSSQQRGGWQQHRASNFESQHQTWEQRGGYQGYRVPEANFNRSFGRGHSFHVSGLPFMDVGGRSRFQYGGYWFSMMDPYPEYWGADWGRNDDMYVDTYGGGYYLYDHRFPGRPGVALSISF